jgi:hypothetical protein
VTTATATAPAPRPDAPRPLFAYRDDGPVAGAIGALIGRLVPAPPVTLVLIGALPLLGVLGEEGDGASDLAAGLAIGWFVLVAGLSAGRPDDSRFRWLAPPFLRLTEYATLVWLGTLAGGDGVPAAFALLCALAFRHYDIVYRIRHQAMEPPAWVGVVGLGWAGRLIVAYVLLLADAYAIGLFVMAGVLGAVFVTETALGWARRGRVAQAVVYEDEEDEGA